MANSKYETFQQCADAIEQYGAQSVYQLGELYRRPHTDFYYALRRASKARKAYILKWFQNFDPTKGPIGWIALWYLGDRNNAKRPPRMSKKVTTARYYEKHKGRINITARRKRNKQTGKPHIISVWKQLLGN